MYDSTIEVPHTADLAQLVNKYYNTYTLYTYIRCTAKPHSGATSLD